jgi:hypothetical protein
MRLPRIVIGWLVLAAALLPGVASAQAQDPRSFPDTGYAITDDAVWAYFVQSGGVDTFGPPISRGLTLLDSQVQVFQNAVLQVQPDGSVQPLQITAEGLLPYRSLDGLTVPAADPAVAYVTPNPDQPNYAARLSAFLNATVPAQFQAVYAANVWGLPTSAPRTDPNNPNFLYQRFQNGILMADSASGAVGPLPLGEYFKAILTGQNLPADLAAEAATSPLLMSMRGGEAFVPDAG